MDNRELDAVYRQYRGIVQRRAMSILGDEQAAKDAAQEIFIRAMQSHDGFRGQASMTTWIYRITTNYCLNVLRDRARRAQLLSEQTPTETTFAPTIDTQIVVSRVLTQLPETLREIAIYFFVDQMNRDEIAELLGVSKRTIGNRLEEFRTLTRHLTSDRRRQVAQ